jgi:hypothetical protein
MHTDSILPQVFTHRRLWHRLTALALSTTYFLLMVFSSLCFATGFYHAHPDRDAHHSHTHHHSHPQPASPTSNHPTTLPDICDFMLQTLTTTALFAVDLPPAELPWDDLLTSTITFVILTLPVARHTIRAPPVSLA